MAFNDPFLRDLEDLSASDDHESDDDQFEDLDHNLNPDEFAEPHEQDYSRLKDDSSLLELLKSLDSETQNKLDAIKKTNDMLKKINPETQIVFKRCRDAYQKQFAELESIITNPFDYARVVKAIGNELKIQAIQELSWLPNNSKLSLQVASSHFTDKNKLLPSEWLTVEKLCDEIVFLEETRVKLLEFLTNQMQIIAPNTAALVGATVCAKLIAAAGGLYELSLTPACNIQVLGSERKALNGFSTSGQLHRGILIEVDLAREAPQSGQLKMIRMLASKTALASRVDVCKTHPRGEEGLKMREGIILRYQKISAPGQSRLTKILAKPDDKPRKKRGGAKKKNQRLKFEMTMQRKLHNQVAFGPNAQLEDMQTGKGLGMLGITGALKVQKQDKGILKTQKLNLMQAKPQTSSNFSGINAGLVSSVAMSSIQGIQLFNPSLQQKKPETNTFQNYFSEKSGFQTVINQRKLNQ